MAHRGGADVGPLGQTFAREVRRLRELRGLSQTDLAARLRERYGLKFHQATIDRVEKGVRPCRLDEVYALAEVLGSTVDDMLADWSSAESAFRELDQYREAGRRDGVPDRHGHPAGTGSDRRRPRTRSGRPGPSNDSADGDQVRAWAEEVLELLDALSAGAERILEGMTAHLPLRPGGVMEQVNRQYFGAILAAHEAAIAARRAEAAVGDAQGLADGGPG